MTAAKVEARQILVALGLLVFRRTRSEAHHFFPFFALRGALRRGVFSGAFSFFAGALAAAELTRAAVARRTASITPTRIPAYPR